MVFLLAGSFPHVPIVPHAAWFGNSPRPKTTFARAKCRREGANALTGGGEDGMLEAAGHVEYVARKGGTFMRTALIGLGAIVGALLVLLLAYAAYVLLNMQRIEDDLPLDVAQNAAETVETGREYTLLTWNLGFGAYSDDFSFFMDGGEHARALSKEAVEENISAMAARVRKLDPDFALLQEVDVDADRSWHVDERAMLVEAFPEMSNSFAVNYHS